MSMNLDALTDSVVVNRCHQVPLNDTAQSSGGAVAHFDCLYESNDKKLVLFETKDGHIVAVDASKLA